MAERTLFHRSFLPFLFLLGMVGCQGNNDAPPLTENQAVSAPPKGPDNPSEATWTHSADGRVGFRVWAEQKSIDANSPIVLIAEIENRSLDSRTFLLPCADELLALTTGIQLVGPQGKTPYRGPHFCGSLGGESFVELACGETARDEITISPSAFPQSDLPGLYTIEYRYISIEHSRPPGLESWKPWIGEAPSAPIEVRKR